MRRSYDVPIELEAKFQDPVGELREVSVHEEYRVGVENENQYSQARVWSFIERAAKAGMGTRNASVVQAHYSVVVISTSVISSSRLLSLAHHWNRTISDSPVGRPSLYS